MRKLIFILTFALTSSAALIIGSDAFAQSPAEREAQRLVPRTPGNWPTGWTVTDSPEQLLRPWTAGKSPLTTPLRSAYCKGSRFYNQPAGSYIQFITDYQTCIEPGVQDSQPLALPAMAFEDLCHSIAYVHNPRSPGGMVQARWIFGCTLESFSDTSLQISIFENYIYNNPNGACYNDPLAICGQTIYSNVRTTCALVANEPTPTWSCFLDGVRILATNDRRTESLPAFDNPVPTDVASQQALLNLIQKHVRSHL